GQGAPPRQANLWDSMREGLFGTPPQNRGNQQGMNRGNPQGMNQYQNNPYQNQRTNIGPPLPVNNPQQTQTMQQTQPQASSRSLQDTMQSVIGPPSRPSAAPN